MNEMNVQVGQFIGKVFHGGPGHSPQSLEERLFGRAKVSESGCWEWQNAKFKHGYGKIGVNGRADYTHRVAYRLVKGQIPDKMLVMHTCDNKICINPDHLTIGSCQDNVDDMIAKGRAGRGCSKLTIEKAREIRLLYATGQYTQNELGEKFGVTFGNISCIVLNKSWRE